MKNILPSKNKIDLVENLKKEIILAIEEDKENWDISITYEYIELTYRRTMKDNVYEEYKVNHKLEYNLIIEKDIIRLATETVNKMRIELAIQIMNKLTE